MSARKGNVSAELSEGMRVWWVGWVCLFALVWFGLAWAINIDLLTLNRVYQQQQKEEGCECVCGSVCQTKTRFGNKNIFSEETKIRKTVVVCVSATV